MNTKNATGFSLTELLVGVALLGLIAAFTIPKVLNTGGASEYMAIAKQTFAALNHAYVEYEKEHDGVPVGAGGFKPSDLTPYMNYVKFLTSGTVDGSPYNGAGWTTSCNSTNPCIDMHNGSRIYFQDRYFCTGSNNDYVAILLDPNGAKGSADGNNDGLWMEFYYDGRVTSYEHRYPGSIASNACGTPVGPVANADPDWFTWEN